MKNFLGIIQYICMTIAMIGIIGMCCVSENMVEYMIWVTCSFGVFLLGCFGAYLCGNYKEFSAIVISIIYTLICMVSYKFMPRSDIAKTIKHYRRNHTWSDLFCKMYIDKIRR